MKQLKQSKVSIKLPKLKKNPIISSKKISSSKIIYIYYNDNLNKCNIELNENLKFISSYNRIYAKKIKMLDNQIKKKKRFNREFERQ